MAKFTNQARLAYNGTVVTSNIARGEITDVLSVVKRTVYGGYSAGGKITYLISIVNTGAVPFTNLMVMDDLGSYRWRGNSLYPLTYVTGSIILYKNGALQSAPTVIEDHPMIINNISVPAKGSVVIVYQTQTTEWAPLGKTGTITNSVTVTGAELYKPVVAESYAAAEDDAILSVVKSIFPIPVMENTRVTYTFTIENTGAKPANAASKVVIEDTFDPKLSNLEVSYNKIAMAENIDYTYDSDSGVFKVKEGIIVIPEAEFYQDISGRWRTLPTVRVLTVTGII